jgi:hypothetical protein
VQISDPCYNVLFLSLLSYPFQALFLIPGNGSLFPRSLIRFSAEKGRILLLECKDLLEQSDIFEEDRSETKVVFHQVKSLSVHRDNGVDIRVTFAERDVVAPDLGGWGSVGYRRFQRFKSFPTVGYGS